MKTFLSILMLIAGITFYAKGEELMFWMVDETAKVDNEDILIFLSNYPEDDMHWNAARIKVTGPGIGTRYLNTYWEDEYGN